MKKIVSTVLVSAAILAPSIADAQQTLRLNTRDMLDVAWAYRDLWQKAKVPFDMIGWTGSAAGCSAGGVPSWVAYKNVQAVNYMRAMAGVPAEDTPVVLPLPQAAAMLLVANNGPKYDSDGMATTTSSYTTCGGSVSTATMSGKGVGFIAGAVSNTAAIQAAMAEEATKASNTQLKNRMELLRRLPYQRAIGMAADGNGVGMVSYGSTANSAPFVAQVQRDWPRQGYFPVDLMSGRIHSTGYSRSVATSVSVSGIDTATITPTTSNYTDYDGQNFVAARITGLPTMILGSPKTVAISYTNLILGSPLGATTNRSYSITLIDPNSVADNILEPGWYWGGGADGGVGMAIEQQGSKAFIAFYGYRASDRTPIWYVGSCSVSLGSKTCSGQFEEYAGGKTLAGSGGQAATLGGLMPFSLAWSANNSPTLTYGSNSVALSRYKPAGGTDQYSTLQTGWYWDRVGGEGWFLEISGGRMFIAAYAYDAAGQPIWYTATADITGSDKITVDPVDLMLCRNGRAITEPAGTRPIVGTDCTSVGTVSMMFTGPDRFTVSVAGRSVNLTRYWFNPASGDASLATY